MYIWKQVFISRKGNFIKKSTSGLDRMKSYYMIKFYIIFKKLVPGLKFKLYYDDFRKTEKR